MIAVLGLGFVGLSTALAFAEKGIPASGFDIDSARMGALAAGTVPFHEPGLDAALVRHLGKNFALANSVADAAATAKAVFICVGTPSGPDGAADLGQIFAAVDGVLAIGNKRTSRVIVIKSTVPPGTSAHKLAPYLAEQGWTVGKDIGLANNPEFLREGKAWEDVTNPDRIVIGAEDEFSKTILNRLHAGFGAPIFNVSWNTGEFIKYLSNTMLATMISFSNDASMIADAIGGIDVKQAFEVLHRDRRWRGNPANMATYVYPGCGFGGYCLPKDTAALRAHAQLMGYDSPMLSATLSINEGIRNFVVKKVLSHVRPNQPVGVLGLSFKAGSDDVRETPAKHVIEGLIEAGVDVVAYDPLAVESFRAQYGKANGPLCAVEYAKDLEQIAARADPIVILTGWPEFRERQHLFAGRTLLDFRYML